MKKSGLLLIFLLCFGPLSFGQDFSFAELVKLRTIPYPTFETYVHDKGYKLNHLENEDKCTVFKNGNSVISYCHYYDNGFSYHKHVVVKFETTSKDEYERLKQQVTAKMQYYKTKLHKASKQHYLEHIYVNDAISVHLYDIAYNDSKEPYYEVEIFSVYSAD